LDRVVSTGDGLTGTGNGPEQTFNVPADVDRLYLGFADSFNCVPFYYGENVGSLTATLATTSNRNARTRLGVSLLAGGLFIGVCFYHRKTATP
jgi:hypothetical protein